MEPLTDIYKIIRGKCVSDDAALAAASEVAEYIENKRGLYYKDQTVCEHCGSRIDDYQGCKGCGHIIE